MTARQMAELEPHLVIVDCHKGDFLLHQGVHEMEQYFILDGILKRVVTNQEGKEMILRFADERDMETSYAALAPGHADALQHRLRHQGARGEAAAAGVGRLPGAPSRAKQSFEYDVMRLMSEIMAHTITLHLLDAPGRVQRFLRKHPELADRIPKKELASYLNLSAETLSRLKHGKI